jgi:hypothetical protein
MLAEAWAVVDVCDAFERRWEGIAAVSADPLKELSAYTEITLQ